MASVAESLVLSLRSQVAQKLNRLPLRFFDQNKACLLYTSRFV